MTPPNPLADWERVGDQFYRKSRIYDAVFDEDVELENYIAVGAPYGGAIGILVVNILIENLFSLNLHSSPPGRTKAATIQRCSNIEVKH